MTDTKLKQANAVTSKYVKGTVALGLVPVPIFDAVALAAAQLKMVHSLAKIYEIEFSKSLGKSLIAALLGGAIPLSLRTSLYSLCKTVSFLGQAVGILGMSILCGSSTYALGKVFIQHFESGGTLLDFDSDKMRT
jgi:uncharacterized protein (DUF697 family)